MLLNKKQLFFRDLFRSRKMLSWLKKICWILFFLLCMIKLYAQSEVIPGLFTTYQQNGRILWVIPDSLLGRDMSLTTTILEGAGRKKKSADAKFGYQGDRFGPRILRWEEEKEQIILKEIRSYVDTSGSYSLGSLLSEREMPLTLQEFEILGCEKTGKIIDVTEWLRDGKLWGLQPFSFLIGIGSEREGRVTAILGTPESVIVRSERIYEAVERTPATSANGEVTRWKLGCCLRLLPRHLMQVRYASSGVGYFTVPYAHMEPGSCQENTEAYLNAMKNPCVNIIGHPDDGRYEVDYEALVQGAKEYGKILELNNHSMDPGCSRIHAVENDTIMLNYCKKYQVPVVMDSDAHFDTLIGEFDMARELLTKLDFPEELVLNRSAEEVKKYLKK